MPHCSDSPPVGVEGLRAAGEWNGLMDILLGGTPICVQLRALHDAMPRGDGTMGLAKPTDPRTTIAGFLVSFHMVRPFTDDRLE
jgi:hypothetical protein